MTTVDTDRAVRVDLPADSQPRRPTAAMAWKPTSYDMHVELQRSIGELGWTPVAVSDGDPRGLAADVLLMLDHGRRFIEYAAQLRRLHRRGQRRPRTILWQFDPYPPPRMPPGAARWMRLGAATWRRLGWMESALGVATLGLLPLKQRVEQARNVRRALTKPMMMAAAIGLHRHAEGALAEMDYRMLRYRMECEQWVRTGVDEGWLDAVFVSSMQKREHLATLGIEATFAPVGCAPRLGEDRNQPRDLDVVFLGTVRQGLHRERMLSKLAPELAHHGLRLEIATSGYRGEKRTAFLNRTKILLHLHQFPWDTPWIRFFLGMANGAMMVSEPLSDPRPFVPGVHYLEAEVERMPALIERYARDEAARRRIVANARALIERDLTMQRSISTILGPAQEVLPRRA